MSRIFLLAIADDFQMRALAYVPDVIHGRANSALTAKSVQFAFSGPIDLVSEVRKRVHERYSIEAAVIGCFPVQVCGNIHQSIDTQSLIQNMLAGDCTQDKPAELLRLQRYDRSYGTPKP